MHCMKTIFLIIGSIFSLYGALYPIRLPLKEILLKTKNWGGIKDEDIEKAEKDFKFDSTISKILTFIGTSLQIFTIFI